MKQALFGVLLLGSTALACSDFRDAPFSPNGSSGHGMSSTTPLFSTVQVLQRVTPLASDLSASLEIGRTGGVIEIPEAGVRVVFPGNSVQSPTRVTVTAHRGSNVAYTFQPHGLVFQQPVIVYQDARVTEAWGNAAYHGSRGAYFAGDVLAGPAASVTEFRPTEYELNGSRFRWTIEHFSGYLLSVP